jgi:CheY-like chemotaxis protein
MVQRALVVDDDTVSRMVLAHMLRRQGWQVSEASDIQPALEAVRESRFDAVFSDFSMPGGTGMDVLDSLPQGHDRPFFVLITGLVEHVAADPDRDRRVDAHLTKPVNSRTLTSCLAGIASRRAGT